MSGLGPKRPPEDQKRTNAPKPKPAPQYANNGKPKDRKG